MLGLIRSIPHDYIHVPTSKSNNDTIEKNTNTECGAQDDKEEWKKKNDDKILYSVLGNIFILKDGIVF